MKFPEEFSFNVKEWGIMELMIQDDHKIATDQLCNLECLPAKTDQLRGRIAYIKDLLASAAAAVKERQR